MPDLDSLQKNITLDAFMLYCRKNPRCQPFFDANLTLGGDSPAWNLGNHSYGPSPLSREKYASTGRTLQYHVIASYRRHRSRFPREMRSRDVTPCFG